MASATKLAAALVAGAGVLAAAYGATADERGSLRIIRTFVQDYTTIEHGDARYTGGPSEGSLTVLQSSGVPFVEGTHQRITCLVYSGGDRHCGSHMMHVRTRAVVMCPAR